LIDPPPQSGDRVLATIRAPAEIDNAALITFRERTISTDIMAGGVQWPLYLTAPASPGAFFCADAIQSHLISRTASQFDPLVQQYIKLDHDGDAKAKGFYNDHMNDPPASRMSDFNNMPIIQWPSVEAYDAFKEYYLASLSVLKTGTLFDDATKSMNVQDRTGAYQGKLETLQMALNAARRPVR
jgi:hypothetical protein